MSVLERYLSFMTLLHPSVKWYDPTKKQTLRRENGIAFNELLMNMKG